jgi:hypothetical protein
MTLSPAGLFRDQSAQLFHQVFDGESCGPGAGYCVGDDLVELALAFGVGSFDFLGADERAGALVSLKQASQLELAVRADNGVGIDGKVYGKLAHGGQLISGSECAGCHGAAHLIDDLAIDRDATVEVEVEAERRF